MRSSHFGASHPWSVSEWDLELIYDGEVGAHHSNATGFWYNYDGLVGGFKHEFYFPFHKKGMSSFPLTFTHSIIFQRGWVGQPPTSGAINQGPHHGLSREMSKKLPRYAGNDS